LFIEFFSFLIGTHFAIYLHHDFLRFGDWLFRLFPIDVRIGELKEVTTANTTGKAMPRCYLWPADGSSSWQEYTTCRVWFYQRGESPPVPESVDEVLITGLLQMNYKPRSTVAS
jgi:hypothetical protein